MSILFYTLFSSRLVLLDVEKVPPLLVGPSGVQEGEELFQCPILGEIIIGLLGLLPMLSFELFGLSPYNSAFRALGDLGDFRFRSTL